MANYETDPLLPTYSGTTNLKSTKTTCSKIGCAVGLVVTICVVIIVAMLVIYAWDQDVYIQYRFKHAAVACDAGKCSEIGTSMLLKDGSAVDAVIASALCINLYQPQTSGIGGGHFFMYYDKGEKRVLFYDSREVAPSGATKDMYNDDHNASFAGGLSVGVPGDIRGLWHAHQKHGKLLWAQLFEPTIALARNGFKVSKALAEMIEEHEDAIRNEPSMSEIFFDSNGKPLNAGAKMYRPLLAETMRQIADGGQDAFYSDGPLRDTIVDEIKYRGGIVTATDLSNYEVKERELLKVPIAGLDFYLAPPPSSGAALALILNILEGYNIKRVDLENNQRASLLYHRIVEAFRYAYAERSFLADPGFVNVTEPVATLTSKEYATEIRNLIQDCCTQDVHDYFLYTTETFDTDDHGTSHISVVDKFGNTAALTMSINQEFGAQFRGDRTGIIYNDEMDDFNKPYETNQYGIPPAEINFIEPGKRPLSSMVPLIALDSNGEMKLATGASGGKKIITGVAQVVMNTIWGEDTMKAAIERARVHNQLIPSETLYEKDLRQSVLRGLIDRGHNTTEDAKFNVCNGIRRTDGGLLDAASDSRRGGYPDGY